MNANLVSCFLRAARRTGNFLTLGKRVTFSQSLLRRFFRHSKSEVFINDFDGGLKVRLRLSEHMQRRIFWMGYYSKDIVALLDRVLEPGMVVVDVGANIGEISMVAARRVGSSGMVYAFEPVGNVADQLEEHVRLNKFSQILVERKALGQNSGERLPMYASCGQRAADENLGLSSLYGGFDGASPIEYVEMTTLDDAVSELSIGDVGLLKIDIEGGELACLRGGEKLLQYFKPMIIVEVQSFSAHQAGWDVDDLFEYLSGFGYEFFAIGKQGKLSSLNTKALSGFQNVFCRPRESPRE